MTREEALKEAQRRWGNDACAVELGDDFFLVRHGMWRTGGWGDSWEAAFADADRREKDSQP